ncbi:hypothetical protein GWI72_14705 [Microvirga tunisiensis]|uniref:Uncharacterized protein n=2 Tax=Pannonibacter tanglangensis TaxID=2750084 RepID=A0ABW9ZJH0_9HYPH|nr:MULTISPECIES: hypothetical protein [unclassified Pannonibacter]NBN65015.1 hypothetical protein [Pannonibacter sp. XCT-34]NBN79524.1 hypothetical protein [Pannonibacter sp. XCT-53]
MAKYDPLREHLARLDEVVWAAKLEDLEKILGSSLPMSAREHRTWWANSGGSLVHQNAWLDAGWRVDHTDLKRDLVVFRRLRIGGTALAQAPRRPETDMPRAAEAGGAEAARLSQMMTGLRESVSVTVRAEWSAVGPLADVVCGSTLLAPEPGVYRLTRLRDGRPFTSVIDARDLAGFHQALRRSLKGLDQGDHVPDAVGGTRLVDRLGIETGVACEIDVVRPGNAWILTDGRGRGAELGKSQERELVARLLAIQERQSGRGGRLLRW